MVPFFDPFFDFQYPTSGRTAWSPSPTGDRYIEFSLSVPYLGSNCLERRCTQRVTSSQITLSVPYLGSNCLEHWDRRQGHGGVLSFQYPTSGRTAWSRSGSARPRPSQPVFQYPTSGRTAWSNANRRVQRGFHRALSVPYLGSNCLEQPPARLCRSPPGSFSTLPRVELPGANAAWVCKWAGPSRHFQYPTSGRTAWSSPRPIHGRRDNWGFQYPTSGRTAWSKGVAYVIVAKHRNFQYPTSGRTAWSFAVDCF